MADVVDPATRSRMMSGIRGKDTRPEVVIRKALFSRGLRYRLHCKNLPGKPDLVFPKYRAVVQINGCFWHGHDCHLFKWPSTRVEFWKEKIGQNIARDLRNGEMMRSAGWRTLVIWECAVKGRERWGLDELIDESERWIRSGTGDGEIRGKDDVVR